MLIGEYEKTEDMIEICEAVRLHCIKEEKFNTNFISVIKAVHSCPIIVFHFIVPHFTL